MNLLSKNAPKSGEKKEQVGGGISRSATQESIDRLQYQVDEDDAIDVSGNGERILDGEIMSQSDPEFKSELEFNGYHSIEEYDNSVLNADVDQKIEPDEELDFDGRAFKINMGEENLVDPQENRAPTAP